MKTVKILFFGIILLASNITAQDTYYSIFSYDHFIPEVKINSGSASLAPALFPDVYTSGSIQKDVKWINANDSDLVNFWATQGDTVLHLLCELSGIEWNESFFEIYLVRYLPTTGSANPTILPIGGIRKNSLIEAMPSDNRLIVDLIYQLSRRMLDQADYDANYSYYPMTSHPLMRPGVYRRDNLAALLALSTAQNVIGFDSAQTAFKSVFWQNHFPGYQLFKTHFLNQWILTPDRTLYDLVVAEPTNSRLVAATRPPRQTQPETTRPREFIEYLPLKGQFGFAVRSAAAGGLAVYKIDTYRLGFASGLREGDVIRRVNGSLVRTHKSLIEKIMETFDKGGATLQIMREGDIETVVLEPLDLYMFDEDAYDQMPSEFDSLMIDTSLIPTADPYEEE